VVEIEAKFRLLEPDAVDVRRLKALLERRGYGVECAPDTIQIVDTYYDTPWHELQKAGAAIRMRDKDGKVLLTYKRKVAQEGALHTRVEMEAAPEAGHLERVHGELEGVGSSVHADLVPDLSAYTLEAFLNTWHLSKTLEIETERSKCNVREADEVVAVLVLDRVVFARGVLKGGYTGVEIEAVGVGDATTVMALSGVLRSELGDFLQEQKISKYEFALEALGE
jgi:inorganic triphosphatase YgiF